MEKQLIIPEPKPITEIKEYEYAGREDITSVVILNSITKIGVWAFSNCTSLAEITIPNSVTEIEEFAFFCCEALTSVTIPDSVTVIRQNVFEGCTGLKEIIIPNSVTEIEFMAFCDCKALTTVNIPESVTKIEGNAFECCTGLKAVAIPEAVTVMEDAFIDCPNLTVLLSKNSKLQNGVFKGCKEVVRVDNPAAELEKIKKTLKKIKIMSDNYSLEYKVIPNLFAQYTQKKIPLNMLAKTTFMQMIMMGKKICWSKIKIDLYDEQIQPAAPDGCRFIAYTFPPVKEAPEAKWGVIDLKEKKYYTFEAGSDDTWFIGSMEGNIHKNYGTSNDMSKTEFVEYVKNLSQDNTNPNK